MERFVLKIGNKNDIKETQIASFLLVLGEIKLQDLISIMNQYSVPY